MYSKFIHCFLWEIRSPFLVYISRRRRTVIFQEHFLHTYLVMFFRFPRNNGLLHFIHYTWFNPFSPWRHHLQKVFYFKKRTRSEFFAHVFILKCSWGWYMFLFKNMYVYGNMYPGGKVQENVGHRGWWLSVICDLVWSCRCCTRCTRYFIWWGQKFIVVVESLSSVIWCGHIWCDHIWCGQKFGVVVEKISKP